MYLSNCIVTIVLLSLSGAVFAIDPQIYLTQKEICLLNTTGFLTCQPFSESICNPRNGCALSCGHCCDPFLATSPSMCRECLKFSCNTIEKSPYNCVQGSEDCWCPDCCSKFLANRPDQCSDCYKTNGCNRMPVKQTFNCNPNDPKCTCSDCCSNFLANNKQECQSCYESNDCIDPHPATTKGYSCIPYDKTCWCDSCCSLFLANSETECDQCYKENLCIKENGEPEPPKPSFSCSPGDARCWCPECCNTYLANRPDHCADCFSKCTPQNTVSKPTPKPVPVSVAKPVVTPVPVSKPPVPVPTPVSKPTPTKPTPVPTTSSTPTTGTPTGGLVTNPKFNCVKGDAKCWCPGCCLKFLQDHDDLCSDCYAANQCDSTFLSLGLNCQPGDCGCNGCCLKFLHEKPDLCMNCYFANNCAIHARTDAANQTIATAAVAPTVAAVAAEPAPKASEDTSS